MGEYISDADIQARAEREAQFFDLESALVVSSVEAGEAEPFDVEKKQKLKKVPVTVRAIRSGAFSQTKGLNNLLVHSTIDGLDKFAVPEIEKWTGLAWGEAFPRIWVLSMDQASTGFAAIWFLNHHLCLRLVAMYDPFHREWNDTKNAIRDEGFWWVILMSTFVYNMPHGPWESCAF